MAAHIAATLGALFGFYLDGVWDFFSFDVLGSMM
jgi:hypothetical protein